MDFLENLESIEGSKLHNKRYALYVVGNYYLSSLGLKSLKKIRSGAIGFQQNQNLCYGRNIPFAKKYNIVEVAWKNNMPDWECGKNKLWNLRLNRLFFDYFMANN